MTNAEKAKVMADKAGIELYDINDSFFNSLYKNVFVKFDPFKNMNHLFMVIKGLAKKECDSGLDVLKKCTQMAILYCSPELPTETALAEATYKYCEQLNHIRAQNG